MAIMKKLLSLSVSSIEKDAAPYFETHITRQNQCIKQHPLKQFVSLWNSSLNMSLRTEKRKLMS